MPFGWNGLCHPSTICYFFCQKSRTVGWSSVRKFGRSDLSAPAEHSDFKEGLPEEGPELNLPTLRAGRSTEGMAKDPRALTPQRAVARPAGCPSKTVVAEVPGIS